MQKRGIATRSQENLGAAVVGKPAVKPVAQQATTKRVLGDVTNRTTSTTVAVGNQVKKSTSSSSLLATKKAPTAQAVKAVTSQLTTQAPVSSFGVRPGSMPAPGRLPAPALASDEDPMVCDDDLSTVPVEEWTDIDEADLDNPLCVTDFVMDIYDNLHQRQASDKYRITPEYMTKQFDINEKMRAILVDWLLDVHLKFRLLPETLYLTVNLIDRFLALKCVGREKLQLVGVTSMFIASKYEEIYPPECNDFVYISANAYTRDEILNMEQTVLNTLQFNLSAPTTLYFLRRFSKAAQSDYRVHTLSKYLAELALLELRLLKYLPSQIAAACVFLARAMTNQAPTWTATLEYYSKVSAAELKPVVSDLNECLKRTNEGTLQAVIRKYASRKFGEVAKIPLVEAIN